MHRREFGKQGEKLAESYLTSRGYQIMERNFSCRFGELDLIATDRKFLVFVEVKSRMTKRFGKAVEAIDRFKKEKLIKSALVFIHQQERPLNLIWRFDLIALQLSLSGRLRNLIHLKNIFDGY